MDFVDIQGVTLERGDHVAWARTRGGTLATGVVLYARLVSYLDRGRGYNNPEVRVRLDSDGRERSLPYDREKFVVLTKAVPEVPPLATRALQAVQKLDSMGIHNPDCAMVREQLGLPWSQAHDVYLALEDLHESGEIKPAAYPMYAYELTAIGRE